MAKKATQDAAAVGVYRITRAEAVAAMEGKVGGTAKTKLDEHLRKWLPTDGSVTTVPLTAAEHAAVAKAGPTLRKG